MLTSVRKRAPSGGIWFYDPSPCVANVDPLDYYDIFFREIAGLGKKLTVFPFYYGIDYTQPEYMIRRWKDADVHRVVYLPMRGFVARPSQFVRAITAARRGQADGTCGFAFPVSAETPENSWQWKAVMLGAWANFPTPELDAYCFIEEPSELVEALAVSDVLIVTNGVLPSTEVQNFVMQLKKLLPGKVRLVEATANYVSEKQLQVILGGSTVLQGNAWSYSLPQEKYGFGKGLLQMHKARVALSGTDVEGVAHAMTLFLRFAELASAESKKIGKTR